MSLAGSLFRLKLCGFCFLCGRDCQALLNTFFLSIPEDTGSVHEWVGFQPHAPGVSIHPFWLSRYIGEMM
jgi:hypothetical protein